GRPVQRRVAQQHVLIRAAGGCRLAERADHDLAAREPFADVVVRFTLELEVHSRKGECPEALARASVEPQADRSGRQAGVADPLGDPPGDARAHREVMVADIVDARERSARVEPRRERVEYLVVEGLDARAVIALHGPATRLLAS